MTKNLAEKLLYKKESKRTKKEKLIRDLVCYGVVVYAAVLGFLLVNANINLANAQAAYYSNLIVTHHAIN